ncbi:uncharacterized protein CTRU02_215309 [Colletotrichum truncatum]|uniref:Uncharacterized protein n=1 Tax=Colletotrichum truncatum TaxID=5467 RepID=A0ACC3YCT8_COLTU|nr:uncharacterized protein CTRU02_13267 [Colletotrichum truncatum]KAF6783504.1 hypothetical protein CTRU02_13267 [Colletotrichum truncatum]
MAGPIQVGDIVNISKVCWDLYKFGWDNDYNATRQYAEFGRDVRGLAQSLDILSRVVIQADQSLRRDGSFTKSLRWDPSSLGEIIGDYLDTINDCVELLNKNHRYRLSSGPVKNIEFNVLVAPAADRLRARIALHNSKILHVLKPFEIDLLCRVREDIHKVHQDLAKRIEAVHGDLHRLIGVLVPDLEQALDRQAHREVHTLNIPPVLKEGLQRAWMNRPAEDPEPTLQEMTDAFVLHYDKSTVHFIPVGILVEDKIPPLGQYISLLKCIWLKQHIRESQQLNQAIPGVSHWPSYVQELEDGLSAQCGRFKVDLVQPSLAGLTPDMLEIWPETEETPLVDVVTKDALMEQVLDIQLQGSTANVQRKLQVLRRMGAEGRRFRINISGVEQGSSRAARRQAETIDFDITTVVLNPLYAVPSMLGSGALDMILRKDERIARLSFLSIKDLVKFQQAVTGFKVFDNYCQYNAMVSFVVSGRDEPFVEDACVQFWIPKQLDGQLVTNNEAVVRENSLPATSSTSRQSTIRSLWGSPDNLTASPTETTPMWNGFGSPAGPSSRNPSVSSASTLGGLSPLGNRPPMSIPRRPVGSGSTQGSGSPPVGNRQTGMASSPSSPRSSSLFPGSWQSAARRPSISTLNTHPDRTFSVSSNVSTTPSLSPSNNSSGNSEAHTLTVSIGGNTTGTVHRRPPKPMIVLYTQNRATRRLALVTVDIDEDTEVNPDRCNCRRSGKDGASCTIASIEQKRGTENMAARRYESRNGDTDWNLAKLALGQRGEREYAAANWKNVRRISIMFTAPGERAKFSGTPNMCQCGTRTEAELAGCLKKQHKGHLGLVREFGRQQLHNYHQARFASQQDVVRGMRDDYR